MNSNQVFARKACTAEGCGIDATIIHAGEPLCGRHALERLEQEKSCRNAIPLKQSSMMSPEGDRRVG